MSGVYTCIYVYIERDKAIFLELRYLFSIESLLVIKAIEFFDRILEIVESHHYVQFAICKIDPFL